MTLNELIAMLQAVVHADPKTGDEQLAACMIMTKDGDRILSPSMLLEQQRQLNIN